MRKSPIYKLKVNSDKGYQAAKFSMSLQTDASSKRNLKIAIKASVIPLIDFHTRTTHEKRVYDDKKQKHIF